MQARSIGPNCCGSDRLGTSAHLTGEVVAMVNTALPEDAMRQADPPRLESTPKWAAYPYWQVIPIVLCAVLLAVSLAVFRTRIRALDIFSAFLFFGAAALSILIVLY